MKSVSIDIDTVGYLLAALVFSVTLLINRTQESASSSLRDASDASWRLSEMILKSDGVSFGELSSALNIAREDRDWTREVTRWVNAGLFIALVVAFLDAERLSWWETHGLRDTGVLALLLMSSAVLVFVLGEFHHNYWSNRSRRGIHLTLVGQLLTLDLLVTDGDVHAALRLTNTLATTYPNWLLLKELRCLLAFTAGNDQEAISIGERIFEEDRYSYSAAMVIAASAVRLGIPHKALGIFESSEGERSEQENVELSRTIGLLAANLDCLIEQDPGTPHILEPDGSRATSQKKWAVDSHGGRSSLEFQWEDFEPLIFAESVYRAWHSDISMPVEIFNTIEPLTYVMSSMSSTGINLEAFERFVEWCQESQSPYGSEIAGVIGLAVGRPTDAFTLLSHASSIRPASSRLHLLMAIAAYRLGWHDRAKISLSNCAQLGGLNSAVYELAHATLLGEGSMAKSIDIAEFGKSRANESIVLASLMGLDLFEHYDVPAPSTTAGRFLRDLCTWSLQTIGTK